MTGAEASVIQIVSVAGSYWGNSGASAPAGKSYSAMRASMSARRGFTSRSMATASLALPERSASISSCHLPGNPNETSAA